MDNQFTKIGSYQYSYEAIIVKGKLEAEGIEVQLADDYTIDTDPLVSNAIGGVKLFVASEQIEEANKILSEINKYSVDDNGKAIICPSCSNATVALFTTVKSKRSLLAFLFSAGLLGTLPLYTKYIYRCTTCHHEFE